MLLKLALFWESRRAQSTLCAEDCSQIAYLTFPAMKVDKKIKQLNIHCSGNLRMEQLEDRDKILHQHEHYGLLEA